MIIDAWIQHPTPAFLRDPMFESLLRWTGMSTAELPPEIPPEFTLAALDAAGVDRALVSAWWGPRGPLLDNDSVAALCRAHPDRFVGIGSVDLERPMDAVRELRRCVNERTNFPMIQPSQCLSQLDQLQLDEKAKRAFLGENALEVFGLS